MDDKIEKQMTKITQYRGNEKKKRRSMNTNFQQIIC
jgi:hypothetical protein